MNSSVAVVMPCKNCENTVEEATLSILNQTYKDTYLLAINDNSDDKTPDILNALLKEYGNKMLVLNKGISTGIVEALNLGLVLATGLGVDYIARQDADDISNLFRIEKQVYFMKEFGLDLSGTWANIVIDTRPDKLKVIEQFHPTIHPGDEKTWLTKFNYLIHGSVMFRAGIVSSIGLYSNDYHLVEDFDYWLRIADKNTIGIVPEYLYTLTRSKNTSTSGNENDIYHRAKELRTKWAKKWGVKIPEQDLPDFNSKLN